MIGKDMKRLTITMNKNSIDLIDKFATALNLTKSDFIESVCCNYIVQVVKKAEDQRKELIKEKN